MPIKKEEIKRTTKSKAVTRKKPADKVMAKTISTPNPSQIQSLAMVTHVHAKPARKFFKFKFSFKRLDQYLATNPTLWQISWSLLWRGFLLILGVRILFVIVSSLMMAFISDTILKIL